MPKDEYVQIPRTHVATLIQTLQNAEVDKNAARKDNAISSVRETLRQYLDS